MEWKHDKEIKQSPPPFLHFSKEKGWWSGCSSKLLFLEKYLLNKFKAVTNILANGQLKNYICATGNQSKEHTHLKEEILT